MIVYPLIKSIRPIEREMGELFHDHFPRFEFIRDKYLIKLTDYPQDPNWRNDTHPDLEHIGMAFYSFLKSLKYIIKNKDKVSVGDPDQTFKNIYFHFGLALESFEEVFRSICTLLQELELLNIPEKFKIEKTELIEKFEKWIDSDYERRFESMLKDGRTIVYYPQHGRDFLSILTNKETRTNYIKYRSSIKNYRNFYIHNPGVDIFIHIYSKKIYVVKKEKVSVAKRWSDLNRLFESHPEFFCHPIDSVQSDLLEMLKHINELSNVIINNLEVIFSNEKSINLIKNYKRENE